MASIDYSYDPTAELADNKIVGEEHSLVGTLAVFPDHELVWEEGFLMEGWNGTAWVEMIPFQDYGFSPNYFPVAARTGKTCFSYILFKADRAVYTKCRISYQVVGQYRDDPLLKMVSDKGAFDRTKLYNWTSIEVLREVSLSTRDPDLINSTALEAVIASIQKLTDAMNNVSGPATTASRFEIQRLWDEVNTIKQSLP